MFVYGHNVIRMLDLDRIAGVIAPARTNHRSVQNRHHHRIRRSGYVNVRMRKWFVLQKITAETLTEKQQSALNCNIFPSNVIDKTHIQAPPTHFL